MGHEIALREEQGQVALRDTVDGWIAVVEPVARLAESIAHTEFVPAGLRGKPAAITAAVLYGREIGLGPIQSLQSVDVIDGRPAVSAEMARALALAAGHEIHVEESTTTRCVVRGRRAASKDWTTITWTMDDAKRAGLDGRKNWRMHPRRMLQARATAELCHLLFADAVGGMPFTVEEALDDSDAAGQLGEAKDRPARRTAKRATPVRSAAPAAQDGDDAGAPPLPGDEAPPEPPAAADPADGGDEASDRISDAQIRALNASMREFGIAERPRRLEITGALAGRELASSKDLTKAEASAVLDTLAKVSESPNPQVRLVEIVEQAQAAAALGRAPAATWRGDPPDSPVRSDEQKVVDGQESLPT